VVVVSSDPHRNGRIDFDNLNGQRRPHKAWDGYSQSKLANLLIVFEVQRRLTDAGSRVRAVAADPGYAATHFQGRRASPISNFFAAVANRVVAQSDTWGRSRPSTPLRRMSPAAPALARTGFGVCGAMPPSTPPPCRPSTPRRPDACGNCPSSGPGCRGPEFPCLQLSLPGRGAPVPGRSHALGASTLMPAQVQVSPPVRPFPHDARDSN
jgi:hypothetical protein